MADKTLNFLYVVSRKLAQWTKQEALWNRAVQWYVWHTHALPGRQYGGKLLFQITGLARSGTTLFTGLINSHPEVFCLSEPYREWVLHGYVTVKFPSEGTQIFRMHPARVLERVGQLLPHPYLGFKETYYAQGHNTLSNWYFFERNVQKGMPTVAIVRDPRDNWRSVQKYMGRSNPLHLRRPVTDRFMNTWNTFVTWALDNDGICLVRYEDLVQQPVETMERVFRHIGLPVVEVQPAVTGVSGIGDPAALQGGTLSARSIGSYSAELDPEDVRRIENTCGSLMRMLGYLS